jgi:regulator of protease activity HflC (stomatin/prohibitin superfamily)
MLRAMAKQAEAERE